MDVDETLPCNVQLALGPPRRVASDAPVTLKRTLTHNQTPQYSGASCESALSRPGTSILFGMFGVVSNGGRFYVTSAQFREEHVIARASPSRRHIHLLGKHAPPDARRGQ